MILFIAVLHLSSGIIMTSEAIAMRTACDQNNALWASYTAVIKIFRNLKSFKEISNMQNHFYLLILLIYF